MFIYSPYTMYIGQRRLLVGGWVPGGFGVDCIHRLLSDPVSHAHNHRAPHRALCSGESFNL